MPATLLSTSTSSHRCWSRFSTNLSLQSRHISQLQPRNRLTSLPLHPRHDLLTNRPRLQSQSTSLQLRNPVTSLFRLLSPNTRSLPNRRTRHQPRNRLIRRHQSRLTSLSRQNHPMRPALRHLSHHTSPNQNPLMHPDRKLLVRIDHLLHRGSHQSSSTVRPRSRTPFMYQHQSRTTNPLSSSTRE